MSERLICTRERGGRWDGRIIYEPDPDAPTMPEIVEVLRNASNMIGWSGVDERMDDYSTLNRIDNLIARLEGA